MVTKLRKIEAILMKADVVTANKYIYTEECLKKMADNKCFFMKINN